VKKHVQRRKKRKRDKATELPEDGQDASVAAAAAAQEAQDDVTAGDLLAPLQVIKVLAHAILVQMVICGLAHAAHAARRAKLGLIRFAHKGNT